MIPGVLKMVKDTLNILLQMLQDFQRMFDHFVETMHYRDRSAFLKVSPL